MTTPHDKALAAFTDYFVRKYPGPDTVIFDPKWHAPKLFNAAMKAIEAARGIVCARELAAWAHRLNLKFDQFITEFTGEPEHPFGKPGEDYSSEYTVTSTPLHIPIEARNGGDGWLDISSAPKTGERILADHAQWGEPEIVAWNDGEDAWCTGSWCWKEAPTHWCPLPARRFTPSDEGEKQP